jgi:opacity protein-like surface antigen
MRKLNLFILLVATFFINATITGQTKQGMILIKGSTSFDLNLMGNQNKDDNNSTKTGSNFSFNIKPGVGFFVVDNLALAIEIEADYNRDKAKPSGDISAQSTLMAGPFFYYYIGESNIKPYVGAGFMLGRYTEKDIPNGGTESKNPYNIFGFGGGAGIAAFLNESVALDANISYQHSRRKPTDNNPTNGRFVTSGIVCSLGIIVTLDMSKIGK